METAPPIADAPPEPKPEPLAPVPVSPDTFRWVRDNDALVTFIDRVQKSGAERGEDPVVVALDTEADSLHSYQEKLCLVQFADGEELALIDPLEISELQPLGDLAANSVIWLHGADFDMRMLKRTFGVVPFRVWDTQVAARLLGFQKFGLAAMIEVVFGVTLSKSSQRADWGKRPLTEKMTEYALNDVRYMLPLADYLMGELEKKNRVAWFEESCEAARQTVIDREDKSKDDVWRISGWGKLSPRGLAYLRELWFWRDGEAERLDRPAFKVMNNEWISKMAHSLAKEGHAEIPQFVRPQQRRRLLDVIKKAREIPQEDWPKKKRPGGRGHKEENEAGYKILRKKRDEVAAELGIDQTLLATRATLERLSVAPEDVSEVLLNWQREVLFPEGVEVVLNASSPAEV